MVQTTERIFLVGDQSAIGMALINRLLYLGHPRSHIDVASAHSHGSDPASVCAWLTAEQPDFVYIVDAPAAGSPTPRSLGPSTATLITAASQAGIARLMLVSPAAPRSGAAPTHTASAANPEAAARHAALQCCASLAAQGLDYRSVSTCEAYGPSPGGIAATDTSSAARLIEDLLLAFSSARARGLDHLTLQTGAHDRLQLMTLNDMAEAVVHVMDLPRTAIEAVTGQRSLHIDIGAARVVSLVELVQATAAAAGYRGRWELTARAPRMGERSDPTLGHDTLGQLGWQPLVSLEVGLELAVMEFRLRHRLRDHTLCTT